jgi:uncharacterized protein YyaL (SSP411 family)
VKTDLSLDAAFGAKYPAEMTLTACRNVLEIAALGAALTLGHAAEPAPKLAAPADQFRRWGDETSTLIARTLWLPDRHLYADKANAGQPPPNKPAEAWGAGVQLTALAARARVEPQRYSESLRVYADALQTYWGEHGGIGGYCVRPASEWLPPKFPDRFYDDNAWLVLTLAETFEVTQRPEYLERAEQAYRFVLSGEDDKLGGGIYWFEKSRDSKNTCSNAPVVVAALRLYSLTHKAPYLDAARRLYTWTCAHLQDTDGLFFDNLKLNGTLDRKKYSYNSALMIRANCLFYALDGKPEQLAEAQRIARAAEAKWIVATGGVADGGRFAHLLTESFLAVYQQDHDAHWLKLVSDALAFVHEKVRDPNGLYPDRWHKPQTAALREFALIDQASAARAFWWAAYVCETQKP